MAEGKKSFVLYSDLISVVEKLSDDDAGKLMKHLLRYVNDMNPEPPNAVVDLVFEPIRLQLKRDLVKWIGVGEKRKISGSKGGIMSGESRRKKQTKQVLKNRSKTKQTQANEAVTVNGTVTGNVNDMNLLFKTFKEMYPGTKRGTDTELEGLKKHADWKTVIYTLPEILEKQIAVRAEKKAKGQFVPEWKNLKTWINQRCWEEEIETPQPTKTEHEGW